MARFAHLVLGFGLSVLIGLFATSSAAASLSSTYDATNHVYDSRSNIVQVVSAHERLRGPEIKPSDVKPTMSVSVSRWGLPQIQWRRVGRSAIRSRT